MKSYHRVKQLVIIQTEGLFRFSTPAFHLWRLDLTKPQIYDIR